MSSPASDQPPGRAVLRIAGALTQVTCAVSLLLGTIAFVLVQQNKAGGIGLVILWSAAAMAGLVFGGLMGRGGLVSVLVSTAIGAGFGIVLLAMDYEALRGILRVLPDSDVGTIADGLVGAAIGMLVVAGLAIAAIPQARRYSRWLNEPVPDVEPSPDLASELEPGAAASHSITNEVIGYQPQVQAAPPSTAFHPHVPTSAWSTARGFPPPPPSRTRTMMLRPATAETRSRRRLYMALGGFAIGVGAGLGVVMSAKDKSSSSPPAPSAETKTLGSATPKPGSATPDSAVVVEQVEQGSAMQGSATQGIATPTAAKPAEPVLKLVNAERAALAKGDYKALAAFAAPTAFAFGVDSDEVNEGRAAIEAQLRHDLGVPPTAGYIVESNFFAAGEDQNHAWIAEELEISAPGVPARRFAVTQLAAFVDGKWMVVAWNWAHQVSDASAERMAILGTLPAPKTIPNKHDGADDLDAAVRAAFGSRKAFVEARSEHPDAFNFGSGPNERASGGAAIKKLFGRLRAEIRLHDGARVVAGSTWDPAQKVPWIGFAAINVDFTSKTRAATDLTQTFRVLAIMVREGETWRIVQTQWSHGGPIPN